MVFPLKLRGFSFFSLFNENVSKLEGDLSTQNLMTGDETSTLLVKFVIMSKHPETRTQVEEEVDSLLSLVTYPCTKEPQNYLQNQDIIVKVNCS